MKPWYRMTKAEWVAACKAACTAAKDARLKDASTPKEPSDADAS